MVASSTNNPTLTDVIKAMDPDGSIAVVVEILTETNWILQDMVFSEGNLPTGHRSTIRTGLPEPTWRQLYQGVQPTKGTTAQINDTTGMLEAYAEIDKALADLNGNTAAYRANEDRAHIEGMSNNMATTVFQGNEVITPERFTGFNARYNDITAGNGENIIDAGGVGSDNASIWLIGWSTDKIFGIFPKGSKAGLTMDDKGQVTIENVDGNGGRMDAYRTHYKWDNGLVVRDWRFAVRIANIDRSLLSPDASTGANLPVLAFEAMERVPNMGTARFAFYCDRKIITTWRQQTENRVTNSTLTVDNVGGVPITSFHAVPLRRTDALAVDEAQVT